jgi:hypothetical protein
MLGVLYVASLFEHLVQSLYVLIRHYKALCIVYHSKLIHFIDVCVCDPVYETVAIHIWGHDDIGVMQESPHFVSDSQVEVLYILESNPHPNLICTQFWRFLKREKS